MRPDRLRPIADRFNLDKEAVLDNVLYIRAYTSEQQRDLLDFVARGLQTVDRGQRHGALQGGFLRPWGAG